MSRQDRNQARAIQLAAAGMRTQVPDSTIVNVVGKNADGWYLVRKPHWPGETTMAVPVVPPGALMPYPRNQVRMLFEDSNPQRPFLYWPWARTQRHARGGPSLPELVSTWRRLGVSLSRNFFVSETDEQGNSVIPISGTLSEPVEADIVRVLLSDIIVASGPSVTILGGDTLELLDPVSALSIGLAGDDIVALTHGASTPPLNCAEAYSRGLEDGDEYAYMVAGLFDAGAMDCANGDGYAWELFSYEDTIRSFEGTTEPGWGWSIPGDIVFSSPSDADCYRDGLVEGARLVYADGSSSEGCGP